MVRNRDVGAVAIRREMASEFATSPPLWNFFHVDVPGDRAAFLARRVGFIPLRQPLLLHFLVKNDVRLAGLLLPRPDGHDAMMESVPSELGLWFSQEC